MVAGTESNDGDPKQVPQMSGDMFRDLVAAAHQVDETMVTAFMAACPFQRLDVALVAPGTIQTNVINSVTAEGGTAEEWSDGDLTTVRGMEKLRDWIMTKSPRLVWFCCPAEIRTKRVVSPESIASSVTCPTLQQKWHPLDSVILCSRFLGTVGQCALEVASMKV